MKNPAKTELGSLAETLHRTQQAANILLEQGILILSFDLREASPAIEVGVSRPGTLAKLRRLLPDASRYAWGVGQFGHWERWSARCHGITIRWQLDDAQRQRNTRLGQRDRVRPPSNDVLAFPGGR